MEKKTYSFFDYGLEKDRM